MEMPVSISLSAVGRRDLASIESSLALLLIVRAFPLTRGLAGSCCVLYLEILRTEAMLA